MAEPSAGAEARMDPLAGLDLEALTQWLDEHHRGLRQGPLEASLITGGLSNLTYRVSDGTSRWALRRPPLAHALPTAHDMAREHRIISALHPAGFPVAAPVALCEDLTVLGAPFYLMAFVDGVVLDRSDVLARIGPHDAAHACDLLVDTLLELHAIDPSAVGLGDLGRPDGFLERQLRRWSTQWTSSETAPRPAVHELVDRLTATLPAQSRPGIVHGDYRLTNVIYALDDASGRVSRIAAVVDWEMATIGDPLADVGLLVVYQELSNSAGFVMPSLAPEAGFATPGQLVERYAAGSPRDLHALHWYIAFGWFKLAVIAEGIHRRHLMGKTVGPGFDQIGAWVPRLLDSGLASLGPSDEP